MESIWQMAKALRWAAGHGLLGAPRTRSPCHRLGSADNGLFSYTQLDTPEKHGLTVNYGLYDMVNFPQEWLNMVDL